MEGLGEPALPADRNSAESSEHAYRAEDFDDLIDSPIYAGNARIHPFEVAGKPHLLVNEGEDSVWDGPRSAADAEKIVREQAAFWGVAPTRATSSSTS